LGGGGSFLFTIRYVAPEFAIQADEGTGILRPAFLTQALDGDEWLASLSGLFTAGKLSGYPLCRRPIGPRAGLDALKKRKINIRQSEKYQATTLNFLHTTGSGCPVDQEIPCNGK